ncbi:2Fe-2S iron-sulfur cluster-binding protein [Pontiellaceae bacterium B1224]|nr:2Fe-2S iron-sulfur cluster-binding protein [Pontiellaceae bacterium B1224]
MPKLLINGLAVEVNDGTTVLDAAEKIGLEIPTLCHAKECEPETSCMLCVVKNNKTGQLIPACSAKVAEGMEIDTECDEVQSARQDILNLLLSEHVGDCEAPCTRVCPAHLDIPLMLREIEQGNDEAAAWIARRDLALPISLGYVCPAPCEKGCRRKEMDAPLKIKNAHRQAAESFQSLKADFPNLGKKVAIIGAGPAGLSSVWKLCQLGYDCTLYDEAPLAGGDLRKHADLPAEVLDAEIEWLERAGITFKLGNPLLLQEIAGGYDGVVFASKEKPVTLFGDAFYAQEHVLTVKAIGNGKEAALQLDESLSGEPVPTIGKRFDSKVGRLRQSEVRELEKNCVAGESAGKSAPQLEAARCLHCDCRKPVTCKLRKYAEQYGADQKAFPADERGHIQLIGHNESVVFEPGKCIKCGLCIKITKQAGEELGLTFQGRGFNTTLAVPFDETLASALKKSAQACVEICPTGALAFRSE